MEYGYTEKEWEDIHTGKWNERYFDVAKRHIEANNIHYPHLFYLLKLIENQQKEIGQLNGELTFEKNACQYNFEQLEDANKEIEQLKNLKGFSTKELYEELIKREGIREIQISLENVITIKDSADYIAVIEGPARLLINQD